MQEVAVMISKKKILTMGLACLFVVNLAGCGKKQAQTGAKEVNVKTMKVIKRDTPITYDYTGFVEAKDEVQIKSRVTGTIVKKLVNGGDVVEAGQLLYVIDPRNYQNTVLQAQANLANAQANLANVQRDQARYQALYDQGAVAKQTLDNYNMQLQQAQATVNAQQALVASAQVDMGETNIVAPFSGKVDTNCLNEGSIVTAQTTVLTSISNSDPMRVKFSLAENDYLKLMNGNTANGVGTKIKSALDGLLADGTGFFSSKDNLLKKAKRLNETEVQTVEDRAKRLEASLTARYVALDSQMSKINALNSYIAQQVTTWNKS